MKKENNSLHITLLADRALVAPENGKAEAKTAAGIIVPTKEDDRKLEIGRVVAVGTGRRDKDGARVPLDVAVGDKVYFKRGYDVEELTLDGSKYVLLGEQNIYAIIN